MVLYSTYEHFWHPFLVIDAYMNSVACAATIPVTGLPCKMVVLFLNHSHFQDSHNFLKRLVMVRLNAILFY